jgi:hypothetical protein
MSDALIATIPAWALAAIVIVFILTNPDKKD